MAGRPKGVGNITTKDTYELAVQYIELGNWSELARVSGLNRKTVTERVKRFIKDNPEEYQKMLDAFLARNKMNMIHQNAHTTKKALDKVDELIEDTTSLKEAAMAYGILYDKGALMKGEATSNSAIVIKMAGDIEELSK